MPLDNEGYKRIYVRNLARNQVIDYYTISRARAPQESSIEQSEASIAEANREGAKGARAFYRDSTGGDADRTIYRVMTNCANVFCN